CGCSRRRSRGRTRRSRKPSRPKSPPRNRGERMDRAWYWKAGLILAVTVLSAWALVPSFTYFRLPAAERNEAAVFEKARPKWAPAKHLNLGLDLQGGIHLVMG